MRAFREVFSYSGPVSGPLLEYCFGFLEDDLTTETLPGDEEIIEDNGNAISVMKCSFFLVERGNAVQLLSGIASLRQRLFNEGSPMMVMWRSLSLHYVVDERTIERYLRRVARHIFRFMSGESNSHRQSIVFCATFRCAFSVADVEALWLNEEASSVADVEASWLNEEARVLQESMESTAFKAYPATQEAVDRLEKSKIGEGSSFDSRDCTICMEELSSDAEHICMPCKHVYHKDCIVAWLKTSHVCPLCRFSLPHD